MMKRVTSSFMMAIAALVAVFVAGTAHAAVVTYAYTNGLIATNSGFTTGLATITPAQMTAGITVPAGSFFRFGVSISVSGNTNPEAGSAWNTTAMRPPDDGDVAVAPFGYGNPTMPANLGLATVGIRINSSNSTGNLAAPLLNGSKSRVAFSSQSWSITDAGDVQGGNAGTSSGPIFRGQGPAAPNDPTFVPKLGLFGTNTTFITNIPYAVTDASQQVSLNIVNDALSTAIWTRTAPGTVDGSGNITADPSFLAQFLGVSDTVNVPNPIIINPVVPEPASMGMIGLTLVGLLSSRRRSK